MPRMWRRWLAVVVPLAVCAAGVAAVWGPRGAAADLAWTVDRGNLVVELIAPGTLRAARSVTYRSPVNGRELEIVQLVPEGTRVEAGDLIARLETRDLVEARQVELGEQNPRFAEVLAGVTEGERVMLVGEPGAGGDEPPRAEVESLVRRDRRTVER